MKKLASIFQALSDETRLRDLKLFYRNGNFAYVS